MAVAKIYPEPEKGGRGKISKAKTSAKIGGFSMDLVDKARTVLRDAPDLAAGILAGSPTLAAAAKIVQERKLASESEETQQTWVCRKTRQKRPKRSLNRKGQHAAVAVERASFYAPGGDRTKESFKVENSTLNEVADAQGIGRNLIAWAKTIWLAGKEAGDHCLHDAVKQLVLAVPQRGQWANPRSSAKKIGPRFPVARLSGFRAMQAMPRWASFTRSRCARRGGGVKACGARLIHRFRRCHEGTAAT